MKTESRASPPPVPATRARARFRPALTAVLVLPFLLGACYVASGGIDFFVSEDSLKAIASEALDANKTALTAKDLESLLPLDVLSTKIHFDELVAKRKALRGFDPSISMEKIYVTAYNEQTGMYNTKEYYYNVSDINGNGFINDRSFDGFLLRRCHDANERGLSCPAIVQEWITGMAQLRTKLANNCKL